MQGDVVTVEKRIKSSPEAIFSLLADASEHPKFDGSGTVKQAKPGAPQRLAQGSEFGMGMKLGVNYSTVNTVIEFEENRRIAWQTNSPGIFKRFLAGRIWRYELDPSDDGTTLVRESWDISRTTKRCS
jgi:uncharacterized protein YndB with AHSA1/START domain